MEKKTLKRIFEFLKEEEQHNAPFKWKHKNNIPLTEDDLNIEGDLELYEEDKNSLPEGLKIAGALAIYGVKNLTSLPKGLKVGSYLSIVESGIKTLPEGLEVGEYLEIDDTPLNNYTKSKIREMIKPGFIKGEIYKYV
jgi:hypothetical protein